MYKFVKRDLFEGIGSRDCNGWQIQNLQGGQQAGDQVGKEELQVSRLLGKGQRKPVVTIFTSPSAAEGIVNEHF